jgi:hypothetical protein
MPRRQKESIVWVAIESILKDWWSVDGDGEGCLPYVVERKRYDRSYEKTKKAIAKRGFLEPLVIATNYSEKTHGNGHHRLAAAIELGYKYIPYVKLRRIFLDDDSPWKHHKHTIYHPENPLPEEPKKFYIQKEFAMA